MSNDASGIALYIFFIIVLGSKSTQLIYAPGGVVIS